MVQAASRFNILIIDDDELVSEYLGALLEAEYYDVTVLNNPVAAVDYFRNHADDFHLVITDQVMPDLTGIEVTQAILALRPAIPVLMITGYSQQITEKNAVSYGLSGFFSKPINEKLFLDKINHLIAC